MTNAAKIEANEAAVVEAPNTPHDLVPEAFRKWKPPAMPVKPVEEVATTNAAIPAKRRPLVYLAGPFSLGDKRKNVAWQADLFAQLVNDGIVWPYSPLTETEEPDEKCKQSHETWMAYSYEVLSRCDAVYRTAAHGSNNYRQWDSVGADLEVAYAERHGIPVFFDCDELYEWAKRREEKQQTGDTIHETGAIRSNDANRARFDLIPQLALCDVAEVLAVGAQKYGAHNYRKGFAFSDTVNHLLRHINLYLRGDKSEKHLAHAACNILFLLEYEHIHPELNDLLTADDYLPPKAANV